MVPGLLLSAALGAAPSGEPPERTPPAVLALEGDTSPVHDPSVIRQGARYHLFASNRFAEKLVPMFCSPDLHRFTLCGNVFDRVPEWAVREVPGARGIWAPDISYLRGRYHLYYSVSTFGKNRSVIGLATNLTLDPTSPDYRWVDEGKVVGSTPEDDWNRDKEGVPMMEGGATLVLEGAKAWRGPGHQAVLLDSDADLLFFHAYDAATGRPTLQISTMVWEKGWPRVGQLK